jgi:hypothetical protein
MSVKSISVATAILASLLVKSPMLAQSLSTSKSQGGGLESYTAAHRCSFSYTRVNLRDRQLRCDQMRIISSENTKAPVKYQFGDDRTAHVTFTVDPEPSSMDNGKFFYNVKSITLTNNITKQSTLLPGHSSESYCATNNRTRFYNCNGVFPSVNKKDKDFQMNASAWDFRVKAVEWDLDSPHPSK